MTSGIIVDNLCKTFAVKKSQTKFFDKVKNIFSPPSQDFWAVKNLSFQIHEGEKVAFIGPNGAGKSTTIKILNGIMTPTSGNARILGLIPWKNRSQLGFHVGTVFGQRTQLWFHLPPTDSFDILSRVYELDRTFYKKRRQELIETFQIEPFLHKPIRALSLGERMRCELVASFLHRPKILFLDEPTIGLDMNAKLMIQRFLNKAVEEDGTILFLTSHDMGDVEKITKRILILDKGSLIIDRSINELRQTYSKKKVVSFTTEKANIELNLSGINVLQQNDFHLSLEIDLEILSIETLIKEMLKKTSLKDIVIKEPSMEEIIRKIYEK